MSDEEDDQEFYLDPSREDEILQDALSNLEVLNQKTINFEDLLNEFVRRGCLSFEEKFKILSGIVDENTSNKTLEAKCNELYQTLLLKKHIPFSKILPCWEDTGNTYLIGRFDTHFTSSGRDSKSLKFSKFKSLPSHRTEFLTHLHLKNLSLSPKSLLKCLRKSIKLKSITLERVKVPYGGRYGDDPSSDFELPLILPNLKEFYLEEVTKPEGSFKCIKEINMFLDELNLKPMLFFGLNSNMAWDAGIQLQVNLRGANVLKMTPVTCGSELEDDLDLEVSEFVSMLRRRPAEYGGFINPQCPEVSLYESYIPKLPFNNRLTHLTLYRCKVMTFDPLLTNCTNLIRVCIYCEYESNNVAQFDLGSLKKSCKTMEELAIGFLSVEYKDKDVKMGLKLSSLCVDCCKFEEIKDMSCVFEKVDSLILVACSSSLVNGFLDIWTNTISVYRFKWDNCEEFEELSKLHEELGKEPNFLLNKDSSGWKGKKILENSEKSGKISKSEKSGKSGKKKEEEEGLGEIIFRRFHWDAFVPVELRREWFDLNFSKEEESDARSVFRSSQEF